jgi:hypothetical protein
MTRLQRIGGAAALLAASTAAALVAVELGIRLANHWFPYFYRYDAELGWRLKPGASGWYNREGEAQIKINRAGFRGPDRSTRKPPTTFRVAVLGDSYVEAIQVPYEQTFCAIMERRLGSCRLVGSRKVEVLNFGVGGYGTAQELITLRRKVWAYSPDAVVLAIFLGNDIRNNSVVLEGDQCRPFYVYRDGKLVPAGPLLDSTPFRLWCMTRFDYRDAQLLGMLKNGWSILTERQRSPTPEYPVERAINYNIYKPPTDTAWQEAWAVTEALIDKMHDEVEAHGALFLAVTLDTGIQVWPNPVVRSNFEKAIGVDDLFYPDRRIKALGERSRFKVLTLAQPLQAYAQAHHIFLHGFDNTPKGFGHWNAEGHRLAGELISAKLCDMMSKAGGGRLETRLSGRDRPYQPPPRPGR